MITGPSTLIVESRKDMVPLIESIGVAVDQTIKDMRKTSNSMNFLEC